MILTDVMRALVMIALFFVYAEWQLYILAFVLHLGSAFFTPIYKSIIPGVVGESLYPRALSYSTVAYNVSDIFGMLIGGLWGADLEDVGGKCSEGFGSEFVS